MRKVFGILLALSLVMSFGLAGCKNPCQKATDHMLGCIKAYCADHADNPQCAEEQLDAFEGFLGAMASNCTDEMAEESREAMGQSCEALLAEMGLE